MLKFIIDTQLPPKLAKFLNTKGCDAIHTTFFSDGHLLQDKEIREIAVRENRIIITKDSDFFDAYLAQGAPPKVLLFQFGNIKQTIANITFTTIFFHCGINFRQIDIDNIFFECAFYKRHFIPVFIFFGDYIFIIVTIF